MADQLWRPTEDAYDNNNNNNLSIGTIKFVYTSPTVFGTPIYIALTLMYYKYSLNGLFSRP